MSILMNEYRPTTCGICGARFNSLNEFGNHAGAHFPPSEWQVARHVAQKCPVCAGVGKLQREPTNTTNAWTETCHGCDGKGWVKV